MIIEFEVYMIRKKVDSEADLKTGKRVAEVLDQQEPECSKLEGLGADRRVFAEQRWSWLWSN